MDLETTQALVAEEVERVRASGLSRAFDWEIDVSDLAVYVRMRPRKSKGKSFLMRALFDDFPRHAPSCVFVSVETRNIEENAWPPGVRHGGSPAGICTPGTREFHDHYHANDGKYEWDSGTYPLLSTLAEIHRLIDQGTAS